VASAGLLARPVSYSISRLAHSIRDMLELASLSAGRPADRNGYLQVSAVTWMRRICAFGGFGITI
jgi:hypothetical protein